MGQHILIASLCAEMLEKLTYRNAMMEILKMEMDAVKRVQYKMDGHAQGAHQSHAAFAVEVFLPDP